MSDTSIRVSDDLADELYARKGRSTSYEEFIWELLAAVDGDVDGGEEPTAVESGETDAESVETGESVLLDDWEPQTDANAARAREETQRVVAWFRETGGRHTKAEIIESVGPEEGTDYWWRAVVRPGLGELAERGVVEYRAGHHDYKAVE